MGVKHTEFWSSAASRLLSGLHEVLDQIYATLETGNSKFMFLTTFYASL
jgi:hypothetical protein